MTVARVVVTTGIVILLAIAVNTYISLHDHRTLASYVRVESVQRVQTIGERCELEEHQALEHGPQEHWYVGAHGRCLRALAKVEARAGTVYRP